MKQFSIQATLVFALVCLPLTGFSDILRFKDGGQIIGQYEGGDPRTVRFRTESGIREYDLLDIASVRISGDGTIGLSDPLANPTVADGGGVSLSFDSGQERIIREWFLNRSNLNGLPPGLRRSSLPPGLQRHIQRNGTLPPGLQRRLHPLPWELEVRLPTLLDGWGRVILGRDVLLIELATSKIVDLLRNVF